MLRLPVRVEDLVTARTVESVRIDFKATWNDATRDSVIQTIAAFANDLQGLNGGYIVLGVQEQGGAASLPPLGLDGLDLEKVQKEIVGQCNRIQPALAPPLVIPETLQGKSIVVIYVPMSDARPHQAPEHCGKSPTYRYYVRVGPETKEAKPGTPLHAQLLELAPRVPFDRRRRTDVPLTTISPRLLAEYLSSVGSDLAASVDAIDVPDTLRRLRLTGGTNGGEAPLNCALLFFTEDPERYVTTCRIELAEFNDDAGGDLFVRREFRGPIPHILDEVMGYLERLWGEVIDKGLSHQLRVHRFVAYPTKALREALVNALYHRSYEAAHAPRIALYPDRLEITSYPGPVAGLERTDFARNATARPVPSRNPTIGELLKNLRLAETSRTGLPKIYASMSENGSPEPRFDFDDERTYFRVTLPAHPGYVTLHALRQAATFWAQGDRDGAIRHLSAALERSPGTGALASQLIEYHAQRGDLARARQVFIAFEQASSRQDAHVAYLAMAKAYLDHDQADDAAELLYNVPPSPRSLEQIELAILQKRSRDLEGAHRSFKAVEAALLSDARALHEFAQVKIGLTKPKKNERPHETDARIALLREAEGLLIRVVDLTHDQPTRRAWAWYDIARVRHFLGEPAARAKEAFDRASQLLPGESKFRWPP